MRIFAFKFSLHVSVFLILPFLLFARARNATVSHSSSSACPSLADADSLSHTQLIQRLTDGCRYDHLERPVTYNKDGVRLPVHVYTRAYIYFMRNAEPHNLQFELHALLQMRFMDPRLTFHKVSPKRQQPILGEKQLSDILWLPHVFLANERESSILGTSEKDILVSISPDGTVITSSRIKATLHCWMYLQKFPFDEQECSTVVESWMYNTSEMVLHWEPRRPVVIDPRLHLTEYVLKDSWANETVVNADMKDLRHGAFTGNYSSLRFTVHLVRQIDFYMIDYFLPSILIVGLSWVSFWLHPDAAPPRVTLGTSALLTFITLATAQGKTLPKVSYIKLSEVWFMACTSFIFASLVEFAFVNTIWRRQRRLDAQAKKLAKQKVPSIVVTDNEPNTTPNSAKDNASKVTTFSFAPSIGTIAPLMSETAFDAITLDEFNNNNNGQWTNRTTNDKRIKRTPEKLSAMIDRRSRFLFPLAFLLFNACFWTYANTW